MATSTLVDTSVLLRLFDDDQPLQQAAARGLFGDSEGPNLAISADGLAAFYDAVTKRFTRTLPEVTARRALSDLAELTVVQLDRDLVMAAADTAAAEGLSLRDAMAVEAAVTAGCSRLATEALPHGSLIRGIRAEDPARSGTDG
jgi:predicted nucleic acid-binding protein